MKLSDRAEATPPSGIRRFFELAEEMDDVISLGVGEPDFSAPWKARAAAIHSLERGRTSYTTNRGMYDLRSAISEHVTRYDLDYGPEEEILVTTGASEAVDLALRAVVDPGDAVAIQSPAYISYGPGVRFSGGEPLPVSTRAENDFVLTYDDLERAGAADAEVLMMCYPNNPTGATATADELAEIAEFAREHDLTVLSDEIYAGLTYQGEHTSISTMPGMRKRTIVFNGFSKAYAMTGLRLGYALGPSEAIDAMNRIHQYTMLSAPTTAQYAALEALQSCDDDVTEMRKQYDRRRRFVISRFRDMGLDCFEATGAFYAFPEAPYDDEQFAEDLLHDKGVALVPGRVFGEEGYGHLRVSYATGMSELKEALNRIEAFLEER
ncbi:pyridoxal phosphate-dependent aminotransferase [Haloplanus sp. C73]|uniref:pyridoxal phosphate-dependent aminotransferase n=1 Tax=Haloplanus sp. C73 TaxID=3421641 RepID=UPI003EC0AF2D